MQNQYIVVDASPIVAQDLAHAIRAFDPKCRIDVVSRATEVLAALADLRPTAVFLHSDPTDDQAMTVAEALREAGVPFALTGTVIDVDPSGAEILASPFSETTVSALLRRLLTQDANLD